MSLLDQLKANRIFPNQREAGEVVMVDPEVKAVNCKNPTHVSPPDLHGKTHQIKTLLVFNGQPEMVCEGCGTIYRKIRIS